MKTWSDSPSPNPNEIPKKIRPEIHGISMGPKPRGALPTVK